LHRDAAVAGAAAGAPAAVPDSAMLAGRQRESASTVESIMLQSVQGVVRIAV